MYAYTALTPDGEQVKSTVEGISLVSAENDLLRQNLRVVKIRERKGLAQIEISPQRVPRGEVMHFSRQIAAFVRTGIPIIDAVQVVEDSTANKRFKLILRDVREALVAGVPFSQALEPHRAVFPPYYLSILASAELTGQLDTVLDQLSIYIERDMEARSAVKSALTYPAVVLAMSVLTMLVMVGFVLPKFVDFFDELNSKLPLPTRMLLGFADFVTTFWWAILLVVVLFVLSQVYIGRTETLKRRRSAFFMNLPVIGPILRYSAVERFCRIIGAMLRAGVPLPETMAAAIESTNNPVFVHSLRTARSEMLEGEGVAEPLARTELFPAAAIQMFRVGEDTGTLDAQIESAANFYARETEYKLKRLTDLFEPAVVVFMGFIVGFVAVALISAMYGVLQGVDTSA
ncbi:type II secretion system F family protein [Aquihabitans sp. G128]|uniref:type II secretion system F family protein n=1 Tax=Aquihabitans sp. G128 TaxID=2849779 RepID=UPI001C230156|nr:type II secretion system F family protein [Aquihabitans sp. G128]QXC59566.1 type II secretion system F family protein [Aquihabitans sp. G128]